MARAQKFFIPMISAAILAHAGMAAASACWLDIYDEIGFNGKHVRIEGPIQLPNLRSLDGADWSNRIDSLAVGPNAWVSAFRKESFRDQPISNPNHPDALKAWGEKPSDYVEDEVSFGPGQKHHHLGELDFHHNINSLKIDCSK